jgi:hypothetical protein
MPSASITLLAHRRSSGSPAASTRLVVTNWGEIQRVRIASSTLG